MAKGSLEFDLCRPGRVRSSTFVKSHLDMVYPSQTEQNSTVTLYMTSKTKFFYGHFNVYLCHGWRCKCKNLELSSRTRVTLGHNRFKKIYSKQKEAIKK